jgi:hypothetical protein
MQEERGGQFECSWCFEIDAQTKDVGVLFIICSFKRISLRKRNLAIFHQLRINTLASIHTK